MNLEISNTSLFSLICILVIFNINICCVQLSTCAKLLFVEEYYISLISSCHRAISALLNIPSASYLWGKFIRFHNACSSGTKHILSWIRLPRRAVVDRRQVKITFCIKSCLIRSLHRKMIINLYHLRKYLNASSPTLSECRCRTAKWWRSCCLSGSSCPIFNILVKL